MASIPHLGELNLMMNNEDIERKMAFIVNQQQSLRLT